LKKLFLIPILIILLIACLGSPVLAADPPNTVDVNWDGSGVVVGSVATGDDAHANFYSGGYSHVGEFHAVDSNNNPYTYNVDSCSFSMGTDITGGGVAWLEVNRNDASTSYGEAGQQSRTYVWTDDGDASLYNRSSTNYASMGDSNHGWRANDHITVTGATNYELQRSMDGGWGNSVYLRAQGSGDADLDCMSAEASAGQVRLGIGCGCYTNADFSATGPGGIFGVDGTAENGANFAGMGLTYGSGVYGFSTMWTGSFAVADYSVTVN